MRNLLRVFRRKTEIMIYDICRLLNLKDCSILSRFERGVRKPSLEVIFTYHLLFNVSSEQILDSEIKETALKILSNIPPLVEELKNQNQSRKTQARISFLISLKDSLSKKYE